MPFARLFSWHRRLPLQAKLTWWNSLVMVLMTLLALAIVHEGVRWSLQKELQSVLDAEAFEMALSTGNGSPDSDGFFSGLERAAAGHIQRGWFVQMFDRQGKRLLWSSQNTPAELRAAPKFVGRRSASLGPDDYRFSEALLPAAEDPKYLVRVGTSLRFIQEDVYLVTRVVTPVLCVALILAPLGGYLLARRATAPLQQIITTTRSLKPDQLDQRLPLRQSGDELDQLSIEINQFLDQIRDYLQTNREFVANAAHELRSPLTALITSVDVALTRDRSPEEYQELLATVLDECRQLSSLANQLLLLAESDAGLLERQKGPARLDEITRAAIDMFRGVAEEKRLHVVCRIPSEVTVMGDATRLRQVVNNLIDNAIKFTPSEGRIEVALTKSIEPYEIRLTVSDTGIGIPPEHQPYVFDRFYQVDSSRRSESVLHGTGLGLSICRSIVQAFGGRIELTSEANRGTTFQIVFPRVPA